MNTFRRTKRPAELALVLLLLLSFGAPSSARVADWLDAVHQVSTIDALAAGAFSEVVHFGTLMELGDFGLGAAAAMAGEMVATGGRFFSIPVDGAAQTADASQGVAFATVTSFRPEHRLEVRLSGGVITEPVLNFLLQANGLLPENSLVVAIRVHGAFRSVTARSVPQQEPPYPPLDDVIARQEVFTRENVEGTLVGYWTPDALQGIAPPGFHYHFVSTDGQWGGHALAFAASDVVIEIDVKDMVTLWLPPGTTGLAAEHAAALDIERSAIAGSIPQTVVRFGARLRHVPLLAPDAVRNAALEKAYGGLVSAELLAAWQKGAATAPGRSVSSPWPDHLAIRRILLLSATEARVEADVVYRTSADPTAGDAQRQPVVLLLERRNGAWYIVSYTAEQEETPGSY